MPRPKLEVMERRGVPKSVAELGSGASAHSRVSLLSNIGTWAATGATTLESAVARSSSFMVGLGKFAINALLWLLTVIGGLLADRADRRRMITLFADPRSRHCDLFNGKPRRHRLFRAECRVLRPFPPRNPMRTRDRSKRSSLWQEYTVLRRMRYCRRLRPVGCSAKRWASLASHSWRSLARQPAHWSFGAPVWPARSPLDQRHPGGRRRASRDRTDPKS
jgi:hypothetical protein